MATKRTPSDKEREKLEIQHLRNQLKEDELQFEKVRYENERARLELEKQEREMAIVRAADSGARTLSFVGAVNQESVIEWSERLRQTSLRFPGEDLVVVFCSPGGSVFDGLALYDQIVDLRSQGHHVTTVARGYAASMGGILLQAGDRRLVGANAHLLIHEIRYNMQGRTSDHEDDLAFSKKLEDRMLALLAERSKMSKSEIRKEWKKKDWWLSAREAVKLGFADRVG